MKKGIFLFFSVMLLSSMSAFAQWTLPVKTSDLIIGETMYLYNKDACAFFRGLGEDGDGIYWGTRAGVAVNGADSIKILPALAVNVPENTRSSSNYDIPWLEEDDGETYLVQVWSSHRQKRWDELWFGCWSLDQIWVDRRNEINGNVNFFWNVKLTETGSYTISVSEKSTCFNCEEIESVLTGGEKLGIDLSSANLVTCLEGYNNGAELSYDWCFVKKSDYEAIDLDYLSRYKAATVLKELIEDSKVAYPSFDFSAAEAVYNNTSSTLEELQNGRLLVGKVIIENSLDESDIIELDVKRDLNKGYTLDYIDVDMDSICGLLGISSISEATVWGVNATTFEFVEDAMNKYDGWRNSDGDFTTWGNGHHICYKYMENGKFELCTASDNEPGIGSSYSLYWAFTTDSDTVLLKTNVRLPGTDEDPLDMTSYISNANYTSVDGWLGNTPTLGSGNAEFFAKVFNSFQTITGLPNGIYKLSVQGFYRAGSKEEAYQAYSEGNDEVLKTLLYARTSDAFYSKPLCSIMDSKAENVLYSSGEEYLMGNGMYIPNTMASSAAYFTAGHYNGNSLYLKVTDGTLTIGLANTDYVANAWSMFGNWTLTYYGANSKHVPVETEDVVNALLNAAVTRSDVELTFKNDKIYPWSIETEGLKNGNCGVSNSSSSISFSYNSSYRTEVSFDWRSYKTSDHQPLQVYIDGVLKTSCSSSSFANKRFYLDAGEHVITFKDSIGNSSSTNNYSHIKNISVKNILPLETVELAENSQPLTFVNDDKFPWTVEDGYIQNSNYGTANSATKFSTTFTVDKPSKFSFWSSTYCYIGNTEYEYSGRQYFEFKINGERYMGRQYGSGKTSLMLEPGEYTMEWCESIYDYTDDLKSRVNNIELSSNWVEVEMDAEGDLGMSVLEKVDALKDVELLKVKGTLNATDWTNIKQMINLLALDLSEAKFDAVPDYAFDELSWLSNVKLPEGMTSIGQYAFRGTQIWDIDIPSTVTYIGQYAFASTRLRSIDFPEDSQLRTIGYSAFYNCISLQEFIMPNTVTTLELGRGGANPNYYASTFSGCTSLKKIHFSDSLSVIEKGVCGGCNSLSDLHLPANLKKIEDLVFNNNKSLINVEFPEALEYLGYRSFYNCDALTKVVLPSTLVHCYVPFEDCDNISEITCKSLIPPYLEEGRDLLYGVGIDGKVLYVPEWTMNNYKLLPEWNGFIIKPIPNYWPERIVVNQDFTLTLPDSLPADYKPILPLTWHVGDANRYATLTVKGNNTLSIKEFGMSYDVEWESRINGSYITHNTLINNASMRADSICVWMEIKNDEWSFISFPFDVKVSDIKPAHKNTNYVIRKYSGKERAEGNFAETWQGMTADSILHAGEGYIWQSSCYDDSGTKLNTSAFYVSAQNNVNKNLIFASDDRTITLDEYQSEFSHNRSWNFIGNPYPSYYDTRFMDFTAPITVWNMYNDSYYAYSPVDDEFILRPGEAFFVQRPVDSGTITFNADGRQVNREVRDLFASETKAQLFNPTLRQVFNLTLSDGEMTDRTRFVINPDAACDYEMSSDANKFMSSDASVPQLYTMEGKVQFAINERPMGDGVVMLGAYFGHKGIYTIALNTKVEGMSVVLVDKLNGKETDLMSEEYTFSAEQGTVDNRFEIHVRTLGDQGDATGVEAVNGQVVVKGDNGQIAVESPAHASIIVYTVDGVRIASATASSATFDVEPGVYMVKVQNTVHKVSVNR